MENTPKKVAKPRLQLVISVLVATSFILAELYVMINQPANVILMVGISVLLLIAVYFVIDAVVDCVNEKEVATREQYDNIYRSEKASYMLLKKNLEEISRMIQDASENKQSDNTQEIVNAQKALAKISLNKNRENAEMIAARVVELERMLEKGFAETKTSSVNEEKQDRLFIELNNLEASLNDRLQGLSDKLSGFQEEIERLADHIAKINTEAITTALHANVNGTLNVASGNDVVLEANIPAMEIPVMEEENGDFAELELSDAVITEESDDLGLSAFADDESADELAALLEETLEDVPVELEDNTLEDSLESVFDSDISDINISDVEDMIMESEDDVLSQLLEVEEATQEEEIDALAELAKAVDETPVVAPAPAAPADNGGKMGQDDIAALIASMTGGDATPTPEPVPEKKPTPPPSDNPNKMMTPEEIAALIANM